MTIEIKQVDVKKEYALISRFMHDLHKNEYALNDKTAQWAEIEEAYMRHVLASQEHDEGVCLIAYADGDPAGFIFGYTEEPDDSRFEVYVGKELYVSDGYVHPHYRRRGIYHKLNERLEQIFIARGVRRITRFTLVANTGMRALLESSGYAATRLMYEKWIDQA